MIKVGDNFYRNLEEQVQYLTNYHDVNQGLVQWGIRVVGQVADASELPAGYNGEFGDAYAVGIEAPFFFYIWTRASAVGESDYWFPFGEISIAGPQGPQGPQGEPGAAGEASTWYYGDLPSNPKEGDMLLQSNGDVLRYQKTGSIELSWVQVTNIKGATGLQGVQGIRGRPGPQGVPGPKGDTGDVGGFINIYGILTNVDQLPNPDTLDNRTIAYLIGTNYPYDLYIQVGDADGPVNWVNSGPLNVSTLVFVNGEAQNIWDADTKVDTTTFNELTTSLSENAIPFWNGTKFVPLVDMKTYGDGEQIYFGTEEGQKLALQDNQVYLQDKLNAADPRKVTITAKGGITFDNFLKRTVYGYDSIDTVPAINSEFGNYDETRRTRLMIPNKSGTIAIAGDVYTKTQIDSKHYGLPQLAGFTIERSTNFTYNNMSCTGTKYVKGTSRAIVFDIWRTANQTLTANPIDALVMRLGRWNTSGIRLDQLLSESTLGNISSYKYIYPIEAHWVVKPETNKFQFNNSGFVVPQIYDAINTHEQATVWGMGVMFSGNNVDDPLVVSGEYIRVMLTNFD